MKANDANTLAASVGCPVGANRVEWLVAEVKHLRAKVALQANNANGTALVLASQEEEIDRLKRERDDALSQIRVEELWQRQITAALGLPDDAGLGAAMVRIDALTPRWQEGEPPCELWQVKAVWREGMSTPVRIKRFEEGLYWWFDESTCRRWNAPIPVRWAPIPNPTEG